ncbi:MAG: member of Set1p complex, histone methyl transferase [Trizodia sp. TS-e1964]|nr:MAG: member of Set1p complex, histone methyl transferase [Trizodia sp. TS-e1964]
MPPDINFDLLQVTIDASSWMTVIEMSVPAPPPQLAAGGSATTSKISDIITTFTPTKLFSPAKPESSCTSLDFDASGEFLLTACDDESLQLYNCKDGTHMKTLFSKKYGAHLARFTHQSQSVIYASTKVDDTIRYLSTHDNQFIRYFRGHTGPVTCLAVSPGSDTFISCSTDNSMRLWDINSSSHQGKLELHQPYLAAFDPSATVIAVASVSTSSILMYDVRNYDKAPFATFELDKLASEISAKPPSRQWTKLEFSNDGKLLLIGTLDFCHYLVDAFSGELVAICHRKAGSTGRSPPGQLPRPGQNSSTEIPGQGDVCFTPDGRYVIGGAGQQNLLIWDTQMEPAQDKNLRPISERESRCKTALVGFNPRYNMIASADREVVFWVPDEHAAAA